MKRNLSGIYFREQIDGKWENICFEDCSEEKQKQIVKENRKEFVGNLAILLGKQLKEIGDKFDIIKD